MRESLDEADRIMAGVESVEPSSMTISSQFLSVWVRMDSMAQCNVLCALKQGKTTERSGGTIYDTGASNCET